MPSEKTVLSDSGSIEHLRRIFKGDNLLNGFDWINELRDLLSSEHSAGTEICKEFEELKSLVRSVMDGDFTNEREMFELADLLTCRVVIIKKWLDEIHKPLHLLMMNFPKDFYGRIANM